MIMIDLAVITRILFSIFLDLKYDGDSYRYPCTYSIILLIFIQIPKIPNGIKELKRAKTSTYIEHTLLLINVGNSFS